VLTRTSFRIQGQGHRLDLHYIWWQRPRTYKLHGQDQAKDTVSSRTLLVLT